jgi:hypothetical protein
MMRGGDCSTHVRTGSRPTKDPLPVFLLYAAALPPSETGYLF